MKAICVLSALAGLAVAPSAAARAGDGPAAGGFVSLFNGRDLTGWTVPEGDGGHWKVVDGAIDYDAQSQASGDKALWSGREYTDFVLNLDWRLKEAPYINKNVPYILPDGTHATDIHGKEMRMALPDADSGVYLRGDGVFQVNIWCWPIGSGEMYGVRTDPRTPPDLRAAVTPRHRADRPVGEWNHFEITVRGKTVKVVLNGITVIPGATIPDLPARGRIAFQHHGGKNRDGDWAGPPSLVQFRNIAIKELPPGSAAGAGALRTLLITGGHDHDIAFYKLFEGYDDLPRMAVSSSAVAFQSDLRDKYDVIVMYDFSRDLDEPGKKHLREFVEGGKGVVVLHHALLNFQKWPWWWQDVVGGSYRLQREEGSPSSGVKDRQDMLVAPAGPHPIVEGIAPFHLVDESYNHMRMSPGIRPLLTTDNPHSDRTVAWIGPDPDYRVVAIQLGHGTAAFSDPSYRAIVHNAIRWAARRLE